MTRGPVLPVLLLALATAARGAEWPSLASGALEDNSFLIEEAYNQEAGVVQHILLTAYDRRSGDWMGTFTQEWPAPSQRHQLSFTLPFALAAEADGGRGIGDVLLNYRLQALTESEGRPAVSPRLSLVLPTGRFRDRLGTGSAGVQLNLPVSKALTRRLAGHLNLGVTVIPHALDPERPGRSERLTSWNGGASVVWLLADAVNLLGELVLTRDAELGRHGVAYRNRVTFNPAARVGWNGPGGVQLVWGVGLPIGLTPDADDFGVLLYLSAEHAVTAAAREERSW